MFKTNDSNHREIKPTSPKVLPKASQVEFESLREFEQWLDIELEALVECFSNFETKQSLRGFLKRN